MTNTHMKAAAAVRNRAIDPRPRNMLSKQSLVLADHVVELTLDPDPNFLLDLDVEVYHDRLLWRLQSHRRLTGYHPHHGCHQQRSPHPRPVPTTERSTD